jgi:hypothetical protein
VAVVTLIKLSFNHYKDGARSFRLATELANSLRVWSVDVAAPLDTANLIVDTI